MASTVEATMASMASVGATMASTVEGDDLWGYDDLRIYDDLDALLLVGK